MTKSETEYFKKKLLAEKAEIEGELSKIAKKDRSSPGGWEATSGGLETDSADDNEVADKLEEMEDNSAITTDLEKQLNEIDAALEKIAKGTYGICEKTGKPIDKKRLEANPSARFSIK